MAPPMSIFTSVFLSFQTRPGPCFDPAKGATVFERRLEQTAADPEP
jgi:hypothetical protein